MSAKIEYLIEKRKVMLTQKDSWLRQYQILGKYIYSKKQQFQIEREDGAFLNDGMINDSTAVRANSAMASAIMGSLWKSGNRTFRVRRSKNIPDTKINNEYYREINQQIADAMEAPKAGFETAFHEEISEEGAFGTGCIALFQGDYENPLNFKSWSIQKLAIEEGPDGYVDTVYYDEKITIAALAERYGKNKLPEDLQKKVDSQKGRIEKVILTVAIEPRPIGERKGVGVFGMPIASYHFLHKDKAILLESGFVSLPARVGRWYKLASETYGRSPGMDALPAIMQINALKESFLIGVEKKVEPPLFILDDGSLGAGVVDTSARGLSVFNSMGRTNTQNPVGTIFDIGELNSVAAAITETREEILQHFLIDRLYDLNNKTRMTLGEAEMRYQIRSDALSSIYARYTAEILNPLIDRAFSIMFEMGLLGITEENFAQEAVLIANGIDPIQIPPDVAEAIVANKRIYEIDYISPAANVMREEEYRGIIATTNNAIQLAGAGADTMTKLDTDRIIEHSARLSGAPMDIVVADDVVKDIRDTRQEQQEALVQAELTAQMAKAGKDAAQGQAALVQ
jgi:hypothetical protein